MIKSLIHITENNNMYLYDDWKRLSLLIHPKMAKIHEKLNEVDAYYLKKYAYLQEHGFFCDPQPVQFGIVDEAMIRESIIQSQQIVFEVTDKCNLSCSYCSYGELYEGYGIRNHQKINARYALNLLKYVFNLRPKGIKNKLSIGFYGGEPLLNMSFIKNVVEVVHQLNHENEIEIDYSMTTNATLLHKHIDFLVVNKFNLLVSLDGNEENQSYRIYGANRKNSFRKVTENIDFVQRNYPEYFTDYVNFNAVLHNRNSVKDIYEFIYVRYNKIPRIAELTMDGVKPDQIDIHAKMFHSKGKSESEYQKEESNLLHTEHQELSFYKGLTEFLKYYSINFYVSNILTLLQNKEEYLPTSTCLPFARRIFCTTDGKLLPCEKISHKYSVRRVNKNIMIDFGKIAQQYNCYYDHLKKKCQCCYAYKFCGLCVFSIKDLDRLDTDGFVCPQFYDQETFANRLYLIFSFLEKYPDDFFHILEEVTIS